MSEKHEASVAESGGAEVEPQHPTLRNLEYPATADRSWAPGLEKWANNQRPKTADHEDLKLYRYTGTRLYQWFSRVRPSVFSEPFGEPLLIARRPAAGAAQSRSEGGFTPGQHLQAMTAAFFNGGGWADPLAWDDFDADGQQQWEAFAKNIAANVRCAVAAPDLLEAARDLIAGMTSTYRARNGRDVGIQGDDGEKVWLVHSDIITSLEAALSKATGQKEGGS